MNIETRFADAEFRPHRWVRGGHAQTLAGYYLPSVLPPYRATRHTIELDDGDRIALHEDRPPDWRPGDPAALLVHGLGGSHRSDYMRRIAARLAARGARVYRLDMRGCGASFDTARQLPHSGRAADAAAALRLIARQCPGSTTALVGFSFGGNMALNLAAEADRLDVGNLALVVAVCPPIDLTACSRHMTRGSAGLYGKWFIRLLMAQLAERARRCPDWPPLAPPRRPRSLWEFDHLITAPQCGFAGAEDYYRQTSPAPHLTRIDVPTLMVAAADDPLVPIAPFARHARSSAVRLLVTPGGGHLGFIAHAGGDPDRRWLDWRLVDWLLGR